MLLIYLHVFFMNHQLVRMMTFYLGPVSFSLSLLASDHVYGHQINI